MRLHSLILLLCGSLVSTSELLSNALANTWQGIKDRNIDPFPVKCIHRPDSETPGDCVSEGISYAMLVALYSNDQTYFDLIWDTAEAKMFNGQCYDWRIGEDGQRMASGCAVDADTDLTFALVSAQKLVDDATWSSPHSTSMSYGERAQTLLDMMFDQKMITPSGHVAAGNGWGGDAFGNPSYYSPAWYREFKRVDKNPAHDWDLVIEKVYDSISKSPGYANGLMPDWMTPEGEFYGSLGYNTYLGGRALYKDAIRIFWRIGTDYLWSRDPRAKDFLENSYSFITSKGGPSAMNFYQMNGELLPEDDVWVFGGGQKSRPRREHSPLTIGMWSIVPYVLDKPDWKEYEAELLRYYEPNASYWGLQIGNETIYNNELYFDQFLSWFGAIVLNGTWVPYV